MPYMTSDDGTLIGYDKVGAGPLVVLVNGALSSREYHSDRPLAERLAASFTVICYERRGRGQSTDTAPYDVAREVEDIEALIEGNGGQAHLYGFSSGAALALRAASRLDGAIECVALADAPYSPATDANKQEFARYTREVDALLRAGRYGDAAARFLGDMLAPEEIDRMRRTQEWRTVEENAPTLAYDNAVMGDGTVPHSLAHTVTVPTLVFGAEVMPFTIDAAEALARLLPDAEVQVLEQPSPNLVAPALNEFFGARARR